MKKLVCMLLVIAMSMTLVIGCGKEENKDATPTPTTAPSVEPQTEEQKSETAEVSETETETVAPTTEQANADTPFGKHGALRVEGSKLVDANGNPYQLYGMSTHGMAWYPKFVNEGTFEFLKDEWNTNCVRLAMYTWENMGYCDAKGNKENLKALVKKGVDAATELGMYVIIDWHVLNDKDPNKFKDEAILFFDEMSKEYADNDNVLYEICNEPNSGPKWADIKTYANDVIPVIRANDPNAIILCGSPTWSQDIDQAAKDPLDFDNVMYTLHFYAGTHKEWLIDRMTSCIEAGLPVFISEFGICDASGNGALDYDSAANWVAAIEKYNVSFMCWNLANKNESSSILKQSCDKLAGWTDEDLNDQGIWIRDWFVTREQ